MHECTKFKKNLQKIYNYSQFIQGSTFIHEFLALIISKYVVVVVIVVGCRVIVHRWGSSLGVIVRLSSGCQVVVGHRWVIVGCRRVIVGRRWVIVGCRWVIVGHCRVIVGRRRVIIGHRRSLSVVVNHHQLLSIIISCRRLSSVVVGRRQLSLVIVSCCRSSSAVIGGYRIVVGLSSVVVSCCQLLSFIIGRCRVCRPLLSGCCPLSSVVVESLSVIVTLVGHRWSSLGTLSMILSWVVVGLCPSSLRHHGSLSHCRGSSHHCQSLSRRCQLLSSIVVSCHWSLYIVVRLWVVMGRCQVVVSRPSHPSLVVGLLSVSPSLPSGHRPGRVIMAMVSHSMVVSHRSSLFEKRNYKMGTYPRSLWTVNHRCQLSSLKLVRKGVRDSLLLTAVRVYDSLELEVTDPKDDQGDVEQENGES